MKQWLFARIIVEKFNNVFGFIILSLLCLCSALAIGYFGITGGVAVLGLILGIPLVIYCLKNNTFGYLMLMAFSTFMAFFSRIIGFALPWGSGIDLLLALMLLGIIVEQVFSTDPDKSRDFSLKNAISIVIFIWAGYILLQVFNPAGTISGWLFGIRNMLRLMMGFIIAQRVLNNFKAANRFVMFFFSLGLIVALYGLYQEYAGLPSFDLSWATKTPERINLLFIQRKWRKWSLLSDSASFGLFMGFCSIVAFVLFLGPFNWKKKLFFFLSGIFMVLAMVYSGTRTAYVMIPIGVIMFVLLNITQIKTLIFSCLCVMVFIVVYFGPFYSRPVMRIRSAFNPEDDPSMMLRDENRQSVQPYIYAHPIGGGLTTTGGYGEEYSPGHPLAGFPPDSGFLKTLLETGWIGLLLELTMYFTIFVVGVTNYYNARDPVIKNYYAAFIVATFPLTIALYAKENIEQFPINFILYGIFVLMYKMISFDKFLNSKK